MRIAMAVIVGAACALTSGGRELPVAPPPRAKPTDADWLPKLNPDARFVEGRLEGLTPNPPTAFPDLVAPPIVPSEWPRNAYPNGEAYAKACPRLHGIVALAIEPTDDTLRKLLKARLNQGLLEFQQHQMFKNVQGTLPPASVHHACLQDIQSAAIELWAERPKELVPWLEELVIALKVQERYMRRRAEIGVVAPSDLNVASRLRLKMEAELWKAKNAK